MELSRYEYQHLNKPDEIRVLRFGSNRARIEVYLIHVEVSNCAFDALSYVWGSPEEASDAIILDKLGNATGWAPLTRNLSQAMRDLRDSEDMEDTFFWIDQLCINQRDESEKNHQVAMMKEIYTQSRRVITYLGPAWPEYEEARGIELLDRIYGNVSNHMWRQIHKAGSLEKARSWIFDGSLHITRLPPDLEIPVGESYSGDEISRRYIEQGWEWLAQVAYGQQSQRLWLVQEQLLNKEITTLRGHRLISWDAITAIPLLFATDQLPRQYRDRSRRRLGPTSPSYEQIEETIYGTWWERRSRLEPETTYTWSSLLHNLLWYQTLLCEDARDRVYAILAISADTKDLGIEPNYSPLNTFDALSIELSVRVLDTSFTLELLGFACLWHRPNSTLPSWCLTLDHHPSVDTPENIALETYTPHPRLADLDVARFRTNNSIMVVQGRILDYVSTPTSSAASPSVDEKVKALQLEYLSDLNNLLAGGFSVEDLTSLLRAITARLSWSPPTFNQFSTNDIMAFHLWAYLRRQCRLLANHAGSTSTTVKNIVERCLEITTDIRALIPHVLSCELNGVESVSREEQLAVTRVSQHALERGRRLGCTRDGRFFNAMHGLQRNDAIVALQGADQLFIIRPMRTAYRLIGDVFVDGLMHGEAYKDLDSDETDYEIELI